MNQSESAFPYEWTHSPNGPERPNGMTLRDYFAAQILPSIADKTCSFLEYDAKKAYEFADAMMEARKNE